MTTVAEGLIQSALDIVCPACSVCVIGMGRLGGREMSYASDLDVLLVWGGPEGGGEDVGETLLRFMHGPSPRATHRFHRPGLRPEGSQGRLIRSLDSYAGYLVSVGADVGTPSPGPGTGGGRGPGPGRAVHGVGGAIRVGARA